MENAFEECKTGEEDQAKLWKLEKPSHDQAVCFIKFSNKEDSYIKPDGYYDVDKIAAQIKEYGFEVPQDMDTLTKFNFDKEPEQFVNAIFTFTKNNMEMVEKTFFEQ